MAQELVEGARSFPMISGFYHMLRACVTMAQQCGVLNDGGEVPACGFAWKRTVACSITIGHCISLLAHAVWTCLAND